MICRKCGGEISEGQEYCDNCGTHVDPIFGGLSDFFAPTTSKPRKNYMAFWALVMGIATAMFGFVLGLNLVSFLTGIHGVVFAILGLTMKNVVPSKKRCIISLILNIGGMLVAAVILYLYYHLGIQPTLG